MDNHGIFCVALKMLFVYYKTMAEVPQEPKMISPEEEIRHLEAKLQEKKRALAAGQGDVSEAQEKEALREALKEHIEDVRPMYAPPEPQVSFTPPPVVTFSGAGQSDDTQAKEEQKAQLRKLVELALSKTIEEAIRVAQRSTPYLLDELHDHLVDDYYDKLMALRKLKKL